MALNETISLAIIKTIGIYSVINLEKFIWNKYVGQLGPQRGWNCRDGVVGMELSEWSCRDGVVGIHRTHEPFRRLNWMQQFYLLLMLLIIVHEQYIVINISRKLITYYKTLFFFFKIRKMSIIPRTPIESSLPND